MLNVMLRIRKIGFGSHGSVKVGFYDWIVRHRRNKTTEALWRVVNSVERRIRVNWPRRKERT